MNPGAAAEAIEIEVRPRADGGLAMARDIRLGLTAKPKELAPKYFYDERGSQLFEQITELEEYYPTRAEREILAERSAEIVAAAGEPGTLVELGSGSAAKTRHLLSAMRDADCLATYVPVDISEEITHETAELLVEEYPGLAVRGLVCDFEHDLERIPNGGGGRLVAFLGGTIGNLYPDQRALFLRRIRRIMEPADRLLIGTDLVKDRAVLEAAYNDSAGVTAEFNRNVLRVVNSGLGADFDPDGFEHVAFFDEAQSWIEMRLRANGAQTVRIDGADLEVTFADGEEIRTEISAKFTRDAVEAELRSAGLALDDFFTDDRTLFGLAFARPVSA
jgi:L-histidine Nalpha-methyltransferase